MLSNMVLLATSIPAASHTDHALSGYVDMAYTE